MTVVALVLAAGRGVRFGGDKRLAVMADGRSLLAHTVDNARAVFEDVRVVLREGERAEAFGLSADCRVVISPEAACGMGHSLAAGAASLADSPAQAVAILLGDMPWIATASLRRLAQAASPSTIVVPCHDGHSGHPVIFGRDLWPALQQLAGDQGARVIVQAHGARQVRLHLDDAGVLRDVDTPGALQ